MAVSSKKSNGIQAATRLATGCGILLTPRIGNRSTQRWTKSNSRSSPQRTPSSRSVPRTQSPPRQLHRHHSFVSRVDNFRAVQRSSCVFVDCTRALVCSSWNARVSELPIVNMLRPSLDRTLQHCVRGVFSAKGPDSSVGGVPVVLLPR